MTTMTKPKKIDGFRPWPGLVVFNRWNSTRVLIVAAHPDYMPPYPHFWAKRESDGCLQYHRYDNHLNWKIDRDFWSPYWGECPWR